jgi:16S rRNA (uracil1498-N3)-methyltransferase
MRRRFFVEQFADNAAVMQGEAAHHVGRVLRAEPGQLYELSDGQRVRLGRIEKVSRERVEFALLDEIPSHEPKCEVTLLLSIVKFDAFEWALEKATELGVSSIIPLAASRSEKALIGAAGKRAERWRRILLESAQQSRRVRQPGLQPMARPLEAFTQGQSELKIVLSERQDALSLRSILANANAKRVALAIGPEGGWSEDELAQAREAGFWEASLGHLILRTETAVIAALAGVNYALSD